jgi:hypothetical protein
MKPSVDIAMQQLITRIRSEFPFQLPEAQVCNGPCQGCSLKLLGFLENELDAWETRLAQGERPGLADLSRLMRTSHKVGRVLQRAGLMDAVDEA